MRRLQAPQGELGTNTEIIAAPGCKTSHEPSSVMACGFLLKTATADSVWTLHTVLGAQVSARPKDDILVTFKPKKQTGF